jgi:outer membrane lipoprotein SlyB
VIKTSTIAVVFAAGVFTACSHQPKTVMSVAYGTVTGVGQQERDTSSSSRAGAIVGGLAGFATGMGQSGSNRALRTLAGGALGSAATRTAARGTDTVLTVSLIKGGTARVIMDDGDFRMGDCVSIEQGGGGANIRRVSNEFCVNNSRVPAQYKAEHQREADECLHATQRLLDAQTDEEIRNAQTIRRILCED